MTIALSRRRSAALYSHSLTCLALFVGLTLCGQTDTDSLRAIWHNEALSDTSRLAALKSLAWDGYLLSQPDSARYYAEIQLDFAQERRAGATKKDARPFDIQMGHALNTIGASHYLTGNYEKALEAYHKSLDIREHVGERAAIASSLNNIGAIYSQQNDYARAKDIFERCLRLYEEAEDYSGMSAAHNSLGVLYKTQGLYVVAIRHYTASLRALNTIGANDRADATLNNIGNIYRAQEDPLTALQYFEEALAIRKAKGDLSGMITSLNNIGYTYLKIYDQATPMQEEDLYKAQSRFEKALEMASELNNKKEVAISYNGMGMVMARQDDFDKAIDLFEQSIEIKEGLDNRSGAVASINNTAHVYLRMAEKTSGNQKKKAYRSAIEKAETALLVAEELGHMLEKKISAETLYTSYKALGDAPKALKMHELLISTRDSLLSAESQRELIRQEYEYDYQEQSLTDSLNRLMADQQVELRQQQMTEELESQGTIIKVLVGSVLLSLLTLLVYRLYQGREKQARIAEANALKLQSSESEMKALRSQMNPHFVFNALQSIQTFLIHNKTDDASAYLLKFSKLMRAVLENSTQEEVLIEEDLKMLQLYMQLESIRLKHPFTYSIIYGDDVDAEEISIPPLILQPIVENAIWHGLQYKDSAGHITITLDRKGDQIVCAVIDDGIGRKSSEEKADYHHFKKESLGMKITAQRLAVLDERKGTESSIRIIDLTSEDGRRATGTRVELTIPILT